MSASTSAPFDPLSSLLTEDGSSDFDIKKYVEFSRQANGLLHFVRVVSRENGRWTHNYILESKQPRCIFGGDL